MIKGGLPPELVGQFEEVEPMDAEMYNQVMSQLGHGRMLSLGELKRLNLGKQTQRIWYKRMTGAEILLFVQRNKKVRQRAREIERALHGNPQLIVRPPGSLMQILAVIFPRKTRDDVFAQIVHDFREEYFRALRSGADSKQLRRIVASHWTGFVLACLMELGPLLLWMLKTLKGAG